MELQNESQSGKRYFEFQYNKLISQKIKIRHFGSIAFNKNCTILFIGEISVGIKIIGFNNKQKVIQTIMNEEENFLNLIYIKKFNQLVSCRRSLISIWCQDKSNCWKPYQTLQEQEFNLCCLIINKEEDLLISANNNEKLMFWKQISSSWSCYQTIDVKLRVTFLSLNNSNTQLIIGEYNKDRIEVVECQSNEKWIITQTIKIKVYAQELIFINANQFLKISKKFLAERGYGFLSIYNQDQETKLFVKKKQIQVQKCSKCQLYTKSKFIQQKNIFLVKYDCCDNLFQINQNGEFVLKQTIQYNHHYLNASQLTEDGRYLVTCDSGEQTISIRKLYYLE